MKKTIAFALVLTILICALASCVGSGTSIVGRWVNDDGYYGMYSMYLEFQNNGKMTMWLQASDGTVLQRAESSYIIDGNKLIDKDGYVIEFVLEGNTLTLLGLESDVGYVSGTFRRVK